jgi:hypothetical protein
MTFIEARPQFMRERSRFEREISALQLPSAWEREGPAAAKPTAKPTLGFEFDLNYGVNFGVFNALKAQMPPGSVFPAEYSELTKHKGRASDGKLADGFTVSRDGPRLEISTMPFEISDDAVFAGIATNVVGFGQEPRGVAKTPDASISVTGIKGHPIHIEHPRTLVDKFPIVVHETGSKKRGTLRFPAATGLAASPQATIALPLGRISALITEIVNSRTRKARKDDLALTGPPTARLGLRTDLAVIARDRVLASTRKMIGKPLLDGTTVTREDMSEALTGFLTLIVMYLLTSVIVDPADNVEEFAKGSLPINLKTPFWQVYKFALTDRERAMFRQLYGNSNVRLTLYRLADRTATKAAGDRRLFPRRTHWDLDRVHQSPVTWDVFIDHHILLELPVLVTKDNNLLKPKHKPGDEILIAPLSSKIDFSKTNPLIAVELRRIGFQFVPLGSWRKFMEQLRAMAKRLNQ